jgi:UDP-N-acetylmuramyl pentapeptide synthase
VGKTTTKDAIYAAISQKVHVRKSEKSFNGEIGVPLTILGCENGWRNPLKWISNMFGGLWLLVVKESYPTWLVLEVGADRPGDIRAVAKWLRPDIAVITGVPEIPVHVEFFDSPESVMREKRVLGEYVKTGGKLVINGDDSRMLTMCAEFQQMMVKYGFEAGNDIVASGEEILYEDGKPASARPEPASAWRRPVGMRFRIDCAGASHVALVRGALGTPRVYAALAALAVGDIVGVDTSDVIRGLEHWVPPSGRMRILEGFKGSTIIDDTYNSSPVAALSALDTLQAIQAKRKIAILGDMLELGKYSAEAHRNVGTRAAACADQLITVGFRARAIGEAALDAGMPEGQIREYEQNETRRAAEELKNELQEDDVVLVKGSQSMRMERIVQELMAEPQHAAELLVRQDEEWKKR